MEAKERKATRREKEQYWQKHLSEWRQSGLSQAEYCRVNHINRKGFGYYKNKHRKKAPVVNFMPVPAIVQTQREPSSTLKVILNDCFKIEVGDGFTPATLEKIVRTLRGM